MPLTPSYFIPVMDLLQQKETHGFKFFSIDVEDLFYSIPRRYLLRTVRELMDCTDTVKFQKQAGISVSTFMELLENYLSSTIINEQGGQYLQKSGTSIGSSISPLLCDIYLAACDNLVDKALKSKGTFHVFRYVDDFLIFFKDQIADVQEILQVFETCMQGLRFTFELPKNGVLQFLDIKIIHSMKQVSWMYSPRSKKGLLPYESAHSKIVKRGMVMSVLKVAPGRFCEHCQKRSFETQIKRLKLGGYTNNLLLNVAEALVSKLKRKSTKSREVGQVKPVYIPYLHRISHNLKNVGARHRVPVVFSAPCRLRSLCRTVNRHAEPHRCQIKQK